MKITPISTSKYIQDPNNPYASIPKKKAVFGLPTTKPSFGALPKQSILETKGRGQEAVRPIIKPVSTSKKVGVFETLKELPGALGETIAKPKESFERFMGKAETRRLEKIGAGERKPDPLYSLFAQELGKNIGVTTVEIATGLAKIPFKIVKTFAHYPTSGKIEEPEWKVPMLGDITTYSKDYKNREIELIDQGIDEDTARLAAMLGVGGEAILDVSILGSWIKSGAETVAKGYTPALQEKIAAWKFLGSPKNPKTLKGNFRQLSKQFHPDLVGENKAIREINKAYTVIKKTGLPTSKELLKTKAGQIAGRALSPISRIMDLPQPKALPLKAITEFAGYRPIAKFESRYKPAMGLSLREVPAKKIVSKTVPKVSKELEPLAKEARKYKSAEEFVRSDFQRRVIAGQDLVKELKGAEIRKTINLDGTITIYHGTSKSNINKILKSGKINKETFFSPAKTGTKYGDSPLDVAKRKFGKEGTIIEIKVDARDIDTAAAGSELFAEKQLVKGIDNIWKAADRPTKKQLTDIYNQATKEVKPEFLKGIEKDITKEIIKKRFSIAQRLKLKEKAETKISKIKTAKDILQRRRTSIKAIKEHFGLTDADLKSITKRDIRLMSNFEFKQFADDIMVKAEKFAERRQAMNELLAQIQEKELNVENLRKAMKLPTMKNMTIDNIKALDEAIKPFQKGDEFLSVRKLETVDRTELKGIKTWREARERLAKKLGVSVEKLQSIKVSEFDRFRFNTALAERNDFYKMMVEETAAKMLASEAEYLAIESKILPLAKGLKPKGAVGRLIPQQKIIRKFMEAPANEKLVIAKEMTQTEINLAEEMTKEFEKAREYLIKMEAMKMGKENYFTHIRRGTLEAFKEDGIVKAFKEISAKAIQLEQNFEILDRATGEVLAMDKFFKFAMHRTGGLVPTENVVRAFLTYMRTFKKKQALDEIVPLVDIYAHSLTPRETTKKGILLHGNLIKFVKEWLNTKKGRHITLIAKQGGKIDRALRAGITFTSLRDLGINIPVSIATEVGEQVTTYQLLGKKNYALGTLRMQTKQGKAIIEKYRNFIGKNPWKELVEPSKEIGDKLMEGIFILFRDASVRANKAFLLGSLSREEMVSGIINPKRLSALQTELGRYRMVEGTTSIIGATPEGRSYTQYKKWAIPILRTNIQNLNNISIKLAQGKVSKAELRKSALEIYRIVELIGFILIIRGLIDIEDDKSFVGKIKNKAYREATTLIQALNPKMFMTVGRLASFVEDLGNNLYLLMTLEKYKTTGKLKGVEKLKRLLTPVAASQFKGVDEKEPETKSRYKSRYEPETKFKSRYKK